MLALKRIFHTHTDTPESVPFNVNLDASQIVRSIHPVASSQRDQQKEVVRLLTLQHGYKVASEMSGVPYDLCRQWGARGKWKLSQTVTKHPITVAADNVASEIESNGKATKLSLSRYAKRAAQDSEQLSTREAPLVHKVAQVAQIVHPEEFNPKGQDQAQVAVNIAILNA